MGLDSMTSSGNSASCSGGSSRFASSVGGHHLNLKSAAATPCRIGSLQGGGCGSLLDGKVTDRGVLFLHGAAVLAL